MYPRELEVIAHDPLNPGFGFALRVNRGDDVIVEMMLSPETAKAVIQAALVASGYYETEDPEWQAGGVHSA